MDSLLGHLYSKIRGAPEDIATESLCYILKNSRSARKKFIEYLYGNSQSTEDLIFKTQVTGENNERPDIIGMNEKRNEILIIEAKFWAYLTDNQPVGYIKRLQKSQYDGLKVLSFICPDKRVSSLWNELKRRCQKTTENSNKSVIFHSNVKMNIFTWKSIINVIKQELIAENSKLLSDIDQLNGLCSKINEEAFLPIQDEELGIDVAKRIYGYYGLVDKITDRLKTKIGADTSGLQATGFRGGYRRYMRVGEWTVDLQFNLKYWIEEAETPLWIGIKEEWDYNPIIQKKVESIEEVDQDNIFINKNGETVVPLFSPTGVDEATIINNLVSFIGKIFKVLNSIENNR